MYEVSAQQLLKIYSLCTQQVEKNANTCGAEWLFTYCDCTFEFSQAGTEQTHGHAYNSKCKIE